MIFSGDNFPTSLLFIYGKNIAFFCGRSIEKAAGLFEQKEHDQQNRKAADASADE